MAYAARKDGRERDFVRKAMHSTEAAKIRVLSGRIYDAKMITMSRYRAIRAVARTPVGAIVSDRTLDELPTSAAPLPATNGKMIKH